jgi:hypothetical protein
VGSVARVGMTFKEHAAHDGPDDGRVGAALASTINRKELAVSVEVI